MSKLGCVASFVVGIAVGVAVSWKVLETKYKAIAEEEIESVKEVYKNRNSKEKRELTEELEDIEEEGKKPKTNAEKRNYSKALEQYNYIEKKEEETKEMIEPYVITPDEFGEKDDYETICLDYYADGVLANEFGEPIIDIDGTVGEENLHTFGQYEEDTIYVRNDELGMDFEICRDLCNFDDSGANL